MDTVYTYSFMENIDSLAADFKRTFYYLVNFETALNWLAGCYDDLWDDRERAFLYAFPRLPRASKALLVRMIMRTGPLFRASKLRYDEIGCPLEAAAPLVALGWVDSNPLISLDELFSLHTKAELTAMLPGSGWRQGLRKADLLALLRRCDPPARCYSDWHPTAQDTPLLVTLTDLCMRFRLMFFGNLRQSWSEFVLADLGIFRYERVALEPASRPFGSRADIDVFLALHACREHLRSLTELNQPAPFETMVRELEAIECGQPWLEQKRHKLLYRLGQQCERQFDWALALSAYSHCDYAGARHRRMRVLERCERHEEALELAILAGRIPENEAELQRMRRMLPRLRAKLGMTKEANCRTIAPKQDELVLARPSTEIPVEIAVRNALGQAAASIEHDQSACRVYYVENGLLNSLFGLLCWDAIFAGVPGAFFHPFQRGPADLHSPGFFAARNGLFTRCLAKLDDSSYRSAIRTAFLKKSGMQSPFVNWRLITEPLIEDALRCIPANHLRLWFERLTRDVVANRTGFPDLIRFWPTQERYEMVEVKAPGDRLQDNQIRWLDYCSEHGMPVRVVRVRWAQKADRADPADQAPPQA